MGKDELRQRRQVGSNREAKSAKELSQAPKASGTCFVCIGRACLAITCLLVAVLGYAYITSPIRAVVISDVHDAAGMKWNREYNSNLRKGRNVFTDLHGPESIAIDEQGNWYTGLADGRLFKISDAGKPTENVRDITSDVGYTADGERSLKRPLGMRIFKGKLYFADSYQGIFSMDLKNLSWEKIIGFNDVSPPLHFTNDLAISKDGTIYFTDASARWTWENAAYSIAEGRCTGRLFKIDPGRKKAEILQDNLCFSNGVEITHDETRLLVSECTRRRILVIDRNTNRTVKSILLHGGADNIRRSPTGGYWVPIPILAQPMDRIINYYPFIRNLMTQFIQIDNVDNYPALKQGTILKLNEELEIEQIHQDLEGKVAWAISLALEYQPGRLLLGSFMAPGIIEFDMPNAL